MNFMVLSLMYLLSAQVLHMFYEGSHSFTCHQTLTILAFTRQPQSITTPCLYSFLPSQKGWPG